MVPEDSSLQPRGGEAGCRRAEPDVCHGRTSSATCSLCVIAKNEAHQIARCLKSAIPVVDQVVVVDTGSADDTVKIARELGAEVYETQWQEDFSLARNTSLEYATGDWVLFLDCDEELDADTAPNLKKVIEDARYDGYWTKLINIFDNQPSTSLLVFRLFRNKPSFRFECPIHEQVLPSVIRNSSPERIGLADLIIHHYGYENNETVLREKIERNLRLLQKAREEFGDTGFINFYFGAEHQRLEDHEKALAYYEASLAKSSLDESYVPAMVRAMIFCLVNLNLHQQGLELIEKYLRHYPDYTDLVYLKGFIYLELGMYSEALGCLNRCVEMGPPPSRYFSLHGIADEKPRQLARSLARSLIEHGRELFRQGAPAQAFSVLDAAFVQLKKTPDEDLYTEILAAMFEMINSATGSLPSGEALGTGSAF